MTVRIVRRRRIRRAAASMFLVWLGSGSAALAHHQSAGSTAGVAVPSLTHGQMIALAPHRSAILALADAVPQPDATVRRLRNFAAMEHSFCLWGLMPGSLDDDASPFNECAHAEFAALRALLVHMAEGVAPAPAALAMQARIQRDIGAHGETLALCRYSDEPFNTAAPVGPDWSALPFHGPTLLTLLAGIVFMAAAGLAVWGLGKPASAA